MNDNAADITTTTTTAAKPRRRARRQRGAGSLFQRKPGGPWIAAYFDGDGKRRERSTRTTSRSDAERIVRGWTQHAALVAAGLERPEGGTEWDRHRTRPLREHLDAFDEAKRVEGRAERHVAETRAMLDHLAEACGWATLGDVTAEGLERYVARRSAGPMPSAPKRQRARWTARTAAKYVTTARGFCRWCVADSRLEADPLARVKKPRATTTRERRSLSVDEWRWLSGVTRDAGEAFGMPGSERWMLYWLAVETGLRASELRSLRRSSLVLDDDRPYVRVASEDTKNRKGAVQYVTPALADELRRHVARLTPSARVFRMPNRHELASMLRADLDAARAAYLDETTDPQQRAEREGDDFLRSVTSEGVRFDFHSLRHTCATWLASSGATAKQVQRVLRHSTVTLSLDRYSHLMADDEAAIVQRMPTVEPITLRATGTDDDTANKGPHTYAHTPTYDTRNAADSCETTRSAVDARGGASAGPAREKPRSRSGAGGIRTHETLTGLPVFKTGAFSRSATAPNISRRSVAFRKRATRRPPTVPSKADPTAGTGSVRYARGFGTRRAAVRRRPREHRHRHSSRLRAPWVSTTDPAEAVLRRVPVSVSATGLAPPRKAPPRPSPTSVSSPVADPLD